MAFLGLDKKQLKQLEFEVVPQRARLQLLRLLRQSVDHQDLNAFIARMNNVVNICRNVLGLPVSLIEQTGFGDYEFVDTGWLRSELEVSMRRPDTSELIETLADLIQEGWLEEESVNEVLAAHGCAVSFDKNMDGDVRVEITPVEEIEADNGEEIPNIRVLIRRMPRPITASTIPTKLTATFRNSENSTSRWTTPLPPPTTGRTSTWATASTRRSKGCATRLAKPPGVKFSVGC